MTRSKWWVYDSQYEFWHGTLWALWHLGGPPYRTRAIHQAYSSDLIQSQGNHHKLLGKTNRRIGGAFYVVKRRYHDYSSLGPGRHHFSSSSDPMAPTTLHIYADQFAHVDSFSNSAFPTPSPSTDAQLRVLGTEGIFKTNPTKSEWSLSTFLGELREGLPRMVGFADSARSRAQKGRNAGSEYLNVEFGWKPLVRDVQEFARIVKSWDETLNKYQSLSGTKIKRSYAWPDITSNSRSTGTGNAVPVLQTVMYKSLGYNGDRTTTVTNRRKRWFRASYTFHIPEGNDFNRRRSEADKLLGVDLDPETLWNLAPWSWMSDWCFNMGQVLGNLSALSNDGLVIHYAYVMEHNSTTVEYQTSNIRYTSYVQPQIFRQTFITESKKRIVATPFGFGLTWEEFSPKQLAILAALGISRT